MRSTRRPSIFVWRSFRGGISARPKPAPGDSRGRRSRCTHYWTYAVISQASSTFRMANSTMFTRSTPASRGQALLLPEAGAIYVMDRGYVDFARLHVLHLAGAFFVTRAKSNMDAHWVYSVPTDRTAGIVCDQTIALNGHYTSQHYPEHLRRIRFRDTETGKTLVFLTNQFGLPATTICALSRAAGKSNCSSNGSNSICGSNASSGHPKMP